MSLNKVLRVLLLTLILAVGAGIVSPQPAQAGDGRINEMPWVNGWGGVAVYCYTATEAIGNYTNGGSIAVRDQNGQIVLRLRDTVIVPKRDESDKTGQMLLIGRSDRYLLYSEANGYFSLYSLPDNEGKTFIGRWYGCTPVKAVTADAPSALVCPADPNPQDEIESYFLPEGCTCAESYYYDSDEGFCFFDYDLV